VHVDDELIAYLKDELPAAERDRVGEHLASCAECRSTHDDFRDILGQLAVSAPEPPVVNWGRWQAELRARVGAEAHRRGIRVRPRRIMHRWQAWAAVSLATAAGLAALVIAIDRGPVSPPQQDITAMEEAALGQRLELLREYGIVERLDLLEDLDVIGQLDRLQSPSKS
jgi:anti-sigma factor RsiW